MCLKLQPESMNSQASWSSSFGFTGVSPWVPRSSRTLLSPVPKKCFQRRFIVTRAVSGFSFETSQAARSIRFSERSEACGVSPARLWLAWDGALSK